MSLWGGRFAEDPDRLVLKFGESISFDRRLYAHDIRGSIAHVNMLGATGIVPPSEARAIVTELQAIEEEIDAGRFEFREEYEDIHLNIEHRLIERLGEVGAKVHAARSRNDQVATDVRLYLRDEIQSIRDGIRALQTSLATLAERYPATIMPGFTHLQRAQPVLFAHHLLAYVEMLERDGARLGDCDARMNVLPLGSAALAGTTLPIDRQQVATELGFAAVSRNSMDAVSDRDFMIEFLAALSIFMMHASRLSEDIILWASQEFAFIEIGDAFCTGSSIMPQKKNPDVAELTRGKTGRVYGSLMALLTTMKGLPLCYNRDMQEDKEQLFDAIDTVRAVLAVYSLMIQSLQPREEAMSRAAMDPSLMATDLAEWLVAQGVPFRSAHRKVGQLVAMAQKERRPLNELSLEAMRQVIPEATAACLTLFDPRNSVRARNSPGGTSPEQVRAQLLYWRNRLFSGK